ncbi:hypothetical protein [Fodinicola feengrottensis]|uniref:hypothetical protein n=1 Tax=Fodinicola feengrottensis TaxID=435914 RepID=UPI002442E87A|nr:hypothetical protein [Fodinicola feengrottensis]
MPPEPWDLTRKKLVFSGPVEDSDDVGAVVLAAARGVGVVAIVDPRSTTGRALLDDLRRVGPVGDAPTEDDTPSVPGLTVEECALLDRLADGESIAAAAEAEFLSPCVRPTAGSRTPARSSTWPAPRRRRRIRPPPRLNTPTNRTF